jgi:mRNA-degrading endonuclease RelE of RelBE toxin-antitoxin system
MSYKLISTYRFGKELKRLARKYPSLKKDFAGLIALLLENPRLGTAIGNNCFKIRMAISSKGKGKSGGARVITYVYSKGITVYLLTIYDKSEKADLAANELNQIIQSLKFE